MKTNINTTNSIGYIYIRTHPSYDVDDVCKVGITIFYPERDFQYATGEFRRGTFQSVFEVNSNAMRFIEKLIHSHFKGLSRKANGGTEFFNKKIIDLLEQYFFETGIEYRKLSNQEIENSIRKYRIKKILKKIDKKELIEALQSTKNTIYNPRKDQEEIIEKACSHFQISNKGLLVLMCGVGKTLISLWISQRLNSKKVLIGVPNRLLLKQWEKSINNLFPNVQCLIVSSGVHVDAIENFLKKYLSLNKHFFVITTYSSSHKVLRASRSLKFVFDLKVLDEVHHLTSQNMISDHNAQTYVQMLNIESLKQISLTATLKNLIGSSEETSTIVSNDNTEYFGEIIDRKSLLWAINEKIVCDYVVQTIVSDETELEKPFNDFRITEENDKRMFLAAYASLKSINDNHSHHLLIYSNNKENSQKLMNYINLLVKGDKSGSENYFNIPGLYYSNYHSEMKSYDQKNIIKQFEKHKFGIISCVYCLGEGWDFPLLDGVVFSENMSSNIRIVQSALRASRLNKYDRTKITKIILPVLDKNDFLENQDNSDFKKIREIIYQIGLEDETISQKIKVFKITVGKNVFTGNHPSNQLVSELGTYDDELTELLKLKTVKRVALNISYEKARKIISEKGIKSKEAYFELCDKDNRLSKEPEVVFKGQFTNWIHYLSIERIYYDLDTCKEKVANALAANPDLKKYYLNLEYICNKLCDTDSNFPPKNLWIEYYDKDLKEIITVSKKKEMRIIY